jgi:archaellum component FlaC
MTEADSVVLKHLRYIRSGVDALRADMREVSGRLGNLNNQFANICDRMVRLDSRMERIERRLETF